MIIAGHRRMSHLLDGGGIEPPVCPKPRTDIRTAIAQITPIRREALAPSGPLRRSWSDLQYIGPTLTRCLPVANGTNRAGQLDIQRLSLQAILSRHNLGGG